MREKNFVWGTGVRKRYVKLARSSLYVNIDQGRYSGKWCYRISDHVEKRIPIWYWVENKAMSILGKMVLSYFWLFEYGARSIFGKIMILSSWSYRTANTNVRPSTWSERRNKHFPKYQPGSIFNTIFKSTSTWSERWNHNFKNIDLARYSNRFSNRYSDFFLIRKTKSNLLEYWPVSKFRFIFKLVFALIHDHEDEITIFSIINLSWNSDLYSNRYSLLCMIRITKSNFLEYRPVSKFRSIFKSVFALIHDLNDETTIFSNIDLARN